MRPLLRHAPKALRVVGLLMVTVVAIGVMVLVTIKSGRPDPSQATEGMDDELPAVHAAVAVRDIEAEEVEVLDRYSGMIRPWERYLLAFEVAGRVNALGGNESGGPLDDGDRVSKGQVLARLDDRIFRARKSETAARLEQATSDWQRAKEVEERDIGAISDADVQQCLTAQAVAAAEHAMAVKNLDDAVLVAPVDAMISRRLINVGESVAPHTPAFELVELDRVLLVLGVPESNIAELQARMREVQRNQGLQDATQPDEALQFRAYVRQIDRNRYGESRPPLVGRVYRIGETADNRTGLFEVEVELPNEAGLLRPGMIARADLVTGRRRGYRIPASSVVFRTEGGRADNPGEVKASVFAFEEEPLDAAASTEPGTPALGRARRVDLIQWIEQRTDVIVLEASGPCEKLVWRGQHRLTDGQRVQRVPFEEPGGDAAGPDRALQPRTVQAMSK